MLVIYVCAVLLGSGLLFLVQPLIGKTLLPLLGGSPAVWNTCMVFFQAVLMAGYLYAHVLVRLRGRWRQILVHGAVLAIALAWLPVGLPAGGSPPTDRSPVGWLLLALAASVGGPFFALSSAAPLLQSWFVRTKHRSSRDPYFLYAAGNAGSVLALLAYPLLVERWLGLSFQRWLWSIGFVVFAAAVLACGLLARGTAAPGEALSGSPPASKPDGRTRLRWMLLAFVPSSLMLGVTQHLSTDISPLPLLWVMPLVLYLLSFVVVFSRGGTRTVPAAAILLPVLAVMVAVQLMLPARERGPVPLQFAVHLLALLAGALVCHGRLAAERPGADRLTEFYLLVAGGGVLGGVFNALVAPAVFDRVAEYPVALVLACVLRPPRRAPAQEPPARAWRKRLRGVLDLLGPALLYALAMAAPAIVAWGGTVTGLWAAGWNGLLARALPGAACLLLVTRRVRFALGLAVLSLVSGLAPTSGLDTIYRERTFFGVHEVLRQPFGEGSWHDLWHGSTRHGAQYDREPLSLLPTTYYAPSGPVGDILGGLAATGEPRRMAFVGLGAGTLAAYGREDWHFTFYEVDPAVVRIATDPELFTYVENSRSEIELVVGDARLALASAPADHYDAIVLDAFSSDAVPVHLITREAVVLYLDRLSPDGILVFHVSSLHLDLSPVLARIAADLGLVALECEDLYRTERQRLEQKNASKWVVLAETREAFRPISNRARWLPPRPVPGDRVWTDDYSDVFGVLSD